MSGSIAGGKAAAVTNKIRHGSDFYAKIGAIGGSVKGTQGGFAANRELARLAGAKGGTISRRGPSKPKPVQPTTGRWWDTILRRRKR